VIDPEFGTFIKRERRRFIAYVRALLRDVSELDPEDIVHDVLIRLLGKPNVDLPFDSLTAYIYRSLRNRVVDHVRVRGRYVSLDEEPYENQDGSPPKLMDLLRDVEGDALEMLQREEVRRALFEALDRLSAIEREVVIAHELEGFTFRELAARLHTPINTLLSHKARGLKKLKKYFHANEEQP
jgi:RNA polymerase sigma factor (sigma-70 family)